MFGWGEFRKDGKPREENRVFSTVWKMKENREEGKPGRKFSLPGPQILSPQIGKKR